jgi:dTDP-glucose pyrophosphorylase/CBS domain-containing protein
MMIFRTGFEMSDPDVIELMITMETPIQDVIRCIDRSKHISIALLVDKDGHLLNTITDGDIRRGILAGISLNEPVSRLLPIKARTPHSDAIITPVGTPSTELLLLMQKNHVRQIPLVEANGKVVDIVVLSDLLPPQRPIQAVVMAGGLGSRLHPLTNNVPKPMLDIDGRPIIELIVERLSRAGIHNISISTNFLADKIKDHFGDGSEFGISINYIDEDRPLGTAGALGLMAEPQGPVLIVNGDILTEVDFSAMLRYHQEQNADLTIGIRHYGFQVPYGVVECDGPVVKQLQEKPHLSFLVNAGIYLLEPAVNRYIPKNTRMDMTELIQKLLDDGRPVVSFPIMEYWLDIGQPDDYEKAKDDARTGKYKNDRNG